MSVETVIGCIFFTIITLIFIIFGIYWINIFYSFKYEFVYLKRFGKLSVIISVFCVINIFIQFIVVLNHSGFIVFTYNVFWIFLFTGIYMSVFTKFYLIYFDYYWYIQTQKYGLYSLLSNKLINNEYSNWFIKHKKTYGNLNYIYKPLCLIWFIVGCIVTIIILCYEFGVFLYILIYYIVFIVVFLF